MWQRAKFITGSKNPEAQRLNEKRAKIFFDQAGMKPEDLYILSEKPVVRPGQLIDFDGEVQPSLSPKPLTWQTNIINSSSGNPISIADNELELLGESPDCFCVDPPRFNFVPVELEKEMKLR